MTEAVKNMELNKEKQIDPRVKDKNNLLVTTHLKKYFPITGGFFKRTVGHVHAVEDVSITIKRGETLGVVGESGCGKSTLGRTILRLLPKTDGEVYYDGKEIFGLSKQELRKMRTNAQIIFQDPYSSLNPRKTVAQICGEALVEHNITKRGNETNERVAEYIEKCGLAPYHIRRYPHEFSGGQRQRIGIARALVLDPKFIVCDEPVSALDVSVQSQVLNLLMDIQEEMGLTYMFISHDLSVVKHISDRIGVMYLGGFVELANKKELYENPLHPYTKTLLSAIPIPDPTLKRNRIILQGDIPSPANPPSGCRFHTRCPEATPECSEIAPEFREVSPEHFVACHHVK